MSSMECSLHSTGYGGGLPGRLTDSPQSVIVCHWNVFEVPLVVLQLGSVCSVIDSRCSEAFKCLRESLWSHVFDGWSLPAVNTVLSGIVLLKQKVTSMKIYCRLFPRQYKVYSNSSKSNWSCFNHCSTECELHCRMELSSTITERQSTSMHYKQESKPCKSFSWSGDLYMDTV